MLDDTAGAQERETAQTLLGRGLLSLGVRTPPRLSRWSPICLLMGSVDASFCRVGREEGGEREGAARVWDKRKRGEKRLGDAAHCTSQRAGRLHIPIPRPASSRTWHRLINTSKRHSRSSGPAVASG